LEGSQEAIRNGMIKLIYMEIINLPTYEGQQNFDVSLKMLRELGFELFNFFSINSRKGQLRQLDAIFIYKG
ncbi:MAG: hypothetical protein AAFY41_07355, partial [Bacteroidota bacterium]